MRAEERIIRFHEAGAKAASEFWLNGHLVGRVSWDKDGSASIVVGLRNGVRVGYQIDYRYGVMVYAEPFKDGLVHGRAKQFESRGRLVFESPFKHGTGTDYWCDDRGGLSEEHPMVAGKPSGRERWWYDGKTVSSETDWLDGKWHGIKREWTKGRLDRGYPQFFIREKQVSRRRYEAAAVSDRTLPPYRPDEDSARRQIPERFLELKRRLQAKLRRRS